MGDGPVALGGSPGDRVFADDQGEVGLLCPLCSDYCEASDAIWRTHEVRGTTVRFMVCPKCRDRTLCPANYHGIHGEIEDDAVDETVGYCSVCKAEFRWYEGSWHDVPPPPIATDIGALNDRLQRGDIDMDGYVRELSGLVGVEGGEPAADGDSERPMVRKD